MKGRKRGKGKDGKDRKKKGRKERRVMKGKHIMSCNNMSLRKGIRKHALSGPIT